MLIWFFVIIATLAIQIPNIWAISKFASEPSVKTAFYIAFMCLPASLISNAGFAYFYGAGFERYSYPVMAVGAYGISLMVAFVVQSIILKEKSILAADYVSMALVLSGLAVMVFREAIQKSLFSN